MASEKKGVGDKLPWVDWGALSVVSLSERRIVEKNGRLGWSERDEE
jgi:hypothetical protein